MLRVYAHPSHLAHAAEGHVERPARVDAALRGIEGALRAEVLEAPAAIRADLLRAHDADMLERVQRACEHGAPLDPDTYTTRASWAAALRAAGGAIAAARSAAAGAPAFAVGRPPGHHATRTRAMGFCLVSNVAIAALALSAEGKRVAIVDVDVHHGNGTQDVVAQDERILFVSLHGWPLYPGSGTLDEAGPRLLNLPLPAGTCNDGYIEVFRHAVLPKVRAFGPDVVLVSAGFDAHHRDPLGNLQLVAPTFHACVAHLRDLQPRIAAVLEGGYDLDAVERCAAATAAALGGAPCPIEEPPVAGARPWGALKARVMKAHPELG